MNKRKKYPVGIQTFEKLREEDFFYMDKTQYVYHLVHSDGKYFFLSRPRRFGKSLLVSTFKSYFEGRKDLFKDLAIEHLEKDWTERPVLLLSLAGGKHMEEDALNRYLLYILNENEQRLGIVCHEPDPNIRLSHLIKAAYEQSGKKVAVLIDEYDAPLLDVVHEEKKLHKLRNIMRNFYSPLKDCDPYLQFVFLTGITKFSQASIFSELNNITNISMQPRYAGICGITKEEIETRMQTHVEIFGEQMGLTYEQAIEALRTNYDGYHFAWPSPDVFNPFSLLSALANGDLEPYWFSTGTPTYLLEMMRKFGMHPSDLGATDVKRYEFDSPTENMSNIIPLLYQSGYMTIKAYDADFGLYTLDIPNREIRIGLFQNLLPYYLKPGLSASSTLVSMAKHIRNERMDLALSLLRDFLATVPYCHVKNHEGHYQQMLFIIFTLLTEYMVEVEVHTPHGRIDMVLMTQTRIYVIELKLNQDARTAMQQIELKNYRERFSLSPLPITQVGINFDTTKGNIIDWTIK